MLQPSTGALILLLNLHFYDSLLYEQDNPTYIKCQAGANIFIYLFINNTYQNGFLKIGGCLMAHLKQYI